MLINKELKIFVYNEKTSNINLFNLSNKVNTVYSTNNSGTGFISYNPNSSFNSLNSLETNKTYLIATKAEALPTIIQAVTTSTTPQPGVTTTPLPEGCFVGWPPVDICTAEGHDRKYNKPEIADTFFNGENTEDSCYCQCDFNLLYDECEKLGYNSTAIDFVVVTSKYGTETIISSPCSTPVNCKCFDGYEYKQSEQKCVEKNPQGACCINGSCEDDVYKENCYGGVFEAYSTCEIIGIYPNLVSKQCFACEERLGFTGYTCPSSQECVYCNTGDFFDPQSCECYENCSDIIQSLPSCESGPRDPGTCECCPPSFSSEVKDGTYRRPIKSFGYSQCLGRCTACDGFDVSWNESKCSCECVEDAEFTCPSVSVKNKENCVCECPSGVKESCESRGYEYIEPRFSGVGSVLTGCGCDCSTPQGKLAQQKCPGAKIDVPGQPDRDRWNPFTCECDCSDTNCVAPKVLNPLNCFCQCPQAIEQGIWEEQMTCPNSNEEFNLYTCECEPKKYGAWCSGQFCPPKGQAGSVFITTGCKEGTFWQWDSQNDKWTTQSFQEGKTCKEISCEIESLPPLCTTTTTVAPTTTISPTTTVAPTTTISPTTTVAPTTTGGPSEYKWYCNDC